MKIIFLLPLISFFTFLESSFSMEHGYSCMGNFDLKEILNKKKITLVITDSGLGGLSVCAGIEEKLKESRTFEEVNLIFFNALPEKGAGYNSMPSTESKAEVFNKALLSMEENFSPDIILIACNTLSVVYPFTQFAHFSKTPVLGIVEFGVEMILSEMNKNVNSQVMILGTETTINSETHRNKLIESGLSADKIIPQAFPSLESEIQDSPKSETVKGMIELYLGESIEKLDDKTERLIVALCCTHYGFSSEIFYATCKNLTDQEIVILNPNEMMVNSIVLEENRNRFSETEIRARVVSRAIIDDDEIRSIGGLINSYAPLSSSALKNYEYNPNLFEFYKK